MAQLNSSVVQGSLRVTDTTYTTNLNLASATASKIAKIDANKNLTSGDLTASEIPNLSTDKLTSGTLGVARGGTGKTSWTQWGVLYASADTTLANTAAGTSEYLLQGNGSAAPSWIQATNDNIVSTIVKRDSGGNFSAGTITATITNATTTEDTTNSLYIVGVTSAASTTLKRDTYAILKKAELTLGAANNAGSIKLFSSGANSKAHIIQGQSTTNDFTHTLPNDTGVLVSLHSGTAKGSATKPVYVPNTSIITECNDYAGGTAVTLNGTNKSADTASFYAPTTYGTAGYILKANGEDETPIWVEKVSYNNLPTNDSFILTEGDNSANPPATAQATIPSNYALNRKIFYSQDTPSVTNADLGMFWFQPASFTMEDLKCLIIGIVATNTTSVTINNDDITTDMVVVKCVLSNPSAQAGDLTWTTTGKDPEDPNSRGNIVVNGTIKGTTAMTFYLIHAR